MSAQSNSISNVASPGGADRQQPTTDDRGPRVTDGPREWWFYERTFEDDRDEPAVFPHEGSVRE